MVGCSKDSEDEPDNNQPIIDYYPIEVTILILDEDANNLFSYKYHGSLDPDNVADVITYTYKGETKPLYVKDPYKFSDDLSESGSRYYFPHFYGVYVNYNGASSIGYPYIRFGEFDGCEDHNESVIINWPDGTCNNIEFTSEAFNAYSTIQTRIDNGRWYKTSYVTFVK